MAVVEVMSDFWKWQKNDKINRKMRQMLYKFPQIILLYEENFHLQKIHES